ncbi:NINE protein [Brachybacterium sp. AOP43-C2-M15]|uniref:NINE protein n=1 Tax=Brachybacterium sp. AOP43-C2-M15 TaxID=3457661 RepID=UPI0040344813
MSTIPPPPPPGGPQQPGQGSPYPPHQAGGWQPQAPQGPAPHGASPYGPPSPNAPHGQRHPGYGPPPAPQSAPSGYPGAPGSVAPVPAQRPPKDFVVAWLLALFLGTLGVDRFYRGFVGLGLLKLITCGGAGLWALIDLLIIVVTGGRDSTGQQLAGFERNKRTAWIVTPIVLVVGMIFSLVSSAISGDLEAAPEPEQVVVTAPVEIEAAPAEEDAEPAEAADATAEEVDDEEPAEEPSDEAAPAAEAPAADDSAADVPAADVPAAQQAMSDAVAQGRAEAESAETDLQRANVLTVRSDAMCESVPDGTVRDWVGTVRTVDANGEGKAVVTIEIEDDIEIGTWNNAFSDAGDNTLIEQGTPLYDAALGLVPGDTVTFSGTLKSGSSGNDTCYFTSNLTEVMSIDSPDYILTFSELQKIG